MRATAKTMPIEILNVPYSAFKIRDLDILNRTEGVLPYHTNYSDYSIKQIQIFFNISSYLEKGHLCKRVYTNH